MFDNTHGVQGPDVHVDGRKRCWYHSDTAEGGELSIMAGQSGPNMLWDVFVWTWLPYFYLQHRVVKWPFGIILLRCIPKTTYLCIGHLSTAASGRFGHSYHHLYYGPWRLTPTDTAVIFYFFFWEFSAQNEENDVIIEYYIFFNKNFIPFHRIIIDIIVMNFNIGLMIREVEEKGPASVIVHGVPVISLSYSHSLPHSHLTLIPALTLSVSPSLTLPQHYSFTPLCLSERNNKTFSLIWCMLVIKVCLA